MEDTQARDLNNVQGTTAGAIVKRGGLVTFASPVGAFASLDAADAVSPGSMIGNISNGSASNVYAISSGGAITTLSAGVSTNSGRWDFINAPVVSGQGPVYGMNGQTATYWGGGVTYNNWSATDAGGTLPLGTMCIYANNQVFVAGKSSNPSRLYFSAIGDPTGWNPANNLGAGFIDLDPNDGTTITALGTIGPYVAVFKPRKTFVIIQPGNATVAPNVRRLSANVGCVAHRSLAEDSNGTYFLAEDRGVYVTNGSKLTPISDLIQPTIDGIQNRANAVGAAFNGHYYLSANMNGATNDTTLDFDTLLNSWWKHTFGSNEFAIQNQGSTPSLLSAKSTSAIIDQCFVPGVYQDNGGNFTWSWSGPWQSPSFYRRRRFPTPYYRKNLRQMRIDGFGAVDFSLAKDFTAGSGVLLHSDIFNIALTGTTSLFAGADGTVFAGTDGSVFAPPTAGRARFFSQGVANAFSVILSNTSNNPAEVFSYLLVITDRKDLIVA